MDIKAELIQALTEMKTAMANCAACVKENPEAVKGSLEIMQVSVDEIIIGMRRHTLVEVAPK